MCRRLITVSEEAKAARGPAILFDDGGERGIRKLEIRILIIERVRCRTAFPGWGIGRDVHCVAIHAD